MIRLDFLPCRRWLRSARTARAHRQNWGEDRVHLHDGDGVLFSLPAGWTDAATADPFVVIADGRCPFTAGGLLELADLVDRLRSVAASGGAVRQITP